MGRRDRPSPGTGESVRSIISGPPPHRGDSKRVCNPFTRDRLAHFGPPSRVFGYTGPTPKSVEMVANGGSWQMASKLEIAPNMEAQMSSRSEQQIAKRELRLDHEVRGYQNYQDKGKPKGKDKGKNKGRGKGGKGKNKQEERQKE